MSVPNDFLADVLKEHKIYKKKELKEIEKGLEQEGELYDLVVNEAKIKEAELKKILSGAFGVPLADLTKNPPDPEMVKKIPEVVSKKGTIVAFAQDKKGLHVATDNPGNTHLLKSIKKGTGKSLVVYFADTQSIESALGSTHHTDTEDLTGLLEPLFDKDIKTKKLEDMSIIKMVHSLLSLAHKNNVSDIHIEPYENETIIRFRIDGLLHDVNTIPKKLHELIVMRIKILSRLRTDEHRSAQDGKLRFKEKDEKVDVRVSIVPVVRGEKVVLRLLSENAEQNNLENLGMRKEDLKIVNSYIKKPWGMILSTGPTGSGKTTTLYAILKKLNTREVNISTIEDPVEYDMEKVNQIQVNAKTNLTFAKGLRAIVRQDPDIIMVGEIRDTETAKIAINSAMTGHLVLSTLHTNDAATTFPRLLDMGVEPFLIASTINLVIAQRLVRRLCEDCKKQAPVTKELGELLKNELSESLLKKYKLNDPRLGVYQAQGCKKCQNTGYKGRIGIFEIIEMLDEYKELVMQKKNAEEIKKYAIEQGMLTMIEDGLQKVQAGLTTIEEVLRVIKE